MTIIQAKVIEDSITEHGDRLTTMVLTYPRFFHQELMTHRVLSRNAASSRAIPFTKMMKRTWNDPAIPIFWGKNQSGMQAYEEVSPLRAKIAEFVWLAATAFTLGAAWVLHKLGLHKQIVNRVYEMFTHIEVVVSATHWDNLTGLRGHPDAEPHFQILAESIIDALNESKPRLLKQGEWHLPFVTDEEREKYSPEELLKFSAARCARVSYLLHDGTKTNPQKDIDLHDRLVVEQPVHASPAEHQGQAAPKGTRSGNFVGFIQYRKTLSNETIHIDPRLVRYTVKDGEVVVDEGSEESQQIGA